MPETTLEDVQKCATALAESAYLHYGPTVVRIHVDLQASGEHPFRVELTDESVPLGGVGSGKQLSKLSGKPSPPKP